MSNLYPSLKTAKIISVDLETYDPDLRVKGPGVRRDGYIIGVAVSTDNGYSNYYPVAHKQGRNLSKTKVFSWLKKELSREHQPKLGANLLYDMDYLYQTGVKPAGLWYDVQIAEPLLDENKRKYNLNALSWDYLKVKKFEEEIVKYCANKNWKGKPQEHLYKMPPGVVAPYAIEDTQQPLAIFKKQSKKLKSQDLWELFILETENLKPLLDMRRRGVPVNLSLVNRLIKKYTLELKKLYKKIGTDDIWAARAIAKIFDRKNIKYNLTKHKDDPKPSFTKDWLKEQTHPLCKALAEARELDKLINTFLKGALLDLQVKSRIHPEFHPLKNDEYGTVTGRFSASHPNPQQFPNPKKSTRAKEVRSTLKAEKGEVWYRTDYSQIELRILAHYAAGPGAEQVRQAYIKDPKTDYHEYCMAINKLERTPSKRITFGVIYGMGIAKCARQLNLSYSKGEVVLKQYHTALPFIKKTIRKVSSVAERRGYIFTILKRRRRFDKWEPYDWELAQQVDAIKDKKEMLNIVKDAIANAEDGIHYRPGVKRAFTYKALNALIQGSAADLMKKALNLYYKSPEYKIFGPPLITVHDELGLSGPDNKQGLEAIKCVKKIMEEAIKFKIPIITDVEKGNNWGEVKEVTL